MGEPMLSDMRVGCRAMPLESSRNTSSCSSVNFSAPIGSKKAVKARVWINDQQERGFREISTEFKSRKLGYGFC